VASGFRYIALSLLVAACPGKSTAPGADAGLPDEGQDGGRGDAGFQDAGTDAGADAGACALSFAASPEELSAPCGGFGYGAGLIAAALGPSRYPDLVFWTVDEDGTNAAVNMLYNHDDGGWISGLSSTLPLGSNLDGGSIEAVAVGDFNGDGFLDLTVSGELGVCNGCPPLGELVLLFGDGDGGLSAPDALPWADQTYSVAFMGPQSLVAADLDGDGLADVASAMLEDTVGEEHEDLVVFLSGGAELQADGGVHYPLTQSNWGLTSLVAADLDGDGRPDIAVAAGDVYLYLNQGRGVFSAPQSFTATYGANWLAVADFDGDGTPDLVVENETGVGDSEVGVQIFLNDGQGSFAAQPAVLLPLGVPASVNYGGQIAAADFTGDGMPDLATFNSVQGNAVLLVLPGLGGGALGVARTFTTSLAHVETPGSATVAAPLTGGPLSDLAVGVPNVGNYCTVLTTLGNDCR
jgi:hypothetical protein